MEIDTQLVSKAFQFIMSEAPGFSRAWARESGAGHCGKGVPSSVAWCGESLCREGSEMPATEVRELSVLAIYVNELAVSEAFYSQQLGFVKIQDIEPGILMKAGEVSLYLEACDREGSSGKPGVAGMVPCFGTESIRGSYEALKAAGVPVNSEYQECGPTFALFRVTDPDGNQLEFAGTP